MLPPPTPARVEDVLGLIPGRYNSHDALTIGNRIAASPWSRIYLGTGSAYPGPVAIKIFIDPADGTISPRAASAYHRALTRVAGHTSDDALFGSIAPLDVFHDLGTVISEWVSGPTLSQCLHGSSRAEACRASHHAGLWLSRLHHAMGPGDGHLDTDELLDKTGAELAQHPWIAKHPLVEAAVGLLCRTAATAGAQPVPWTSVHGDYKPDNLIVTEGKLYGLDFDVVHRGPVTLDAAQFLNHLALYFYSPGLLTQLINRHRIAQAFLDGYEQTGGLILPRPALVWTRLHHAIRCLVKLGQWSPPPKSWVTQWTIRRLIADLVDEANYLFDPLGGRERARATQIPAFVSFGGQQ